MPQGSGALAYRRSDLKRGQTIPPSTYTSLGAVFGSSELCRRRSGEFACKSIKWGRSTSDQKLPGHLQTSGIFLRDTIAFAAVARAHRHRKHLQALSAPWCGNTDHARLFILSNNHVLAGCNHVPKGQPILSPSSSDGRPLVRAPGEVGRHDQIHELRSGHPALVNPCDTDLALAVVTDDAILSSWQGDARLGYDTPASVSDPLSMMRVKKFGRTTGLSFGTVEAKVANSTGNFLFS